MNLYKYFSEYLYKNKYIPFLLLFSRDLLLPLHTFLSSTYDSTSRETDSASPLIAYYYGQPLTLSKVFLLLSSEQLNFTSNFLYKTIFGSTQKNCWGGGGV